MCDMMQTLTLLKRFANSTHPGADGLSIENRLRTRMGAIIDTIKHCAKVCDTYQKRHTAVKLFTSSKWQGKFAEVAQQFTDHKSGIQYDLQIHASDGIATANVTLTAMNTSISQLKDSVIELMKTVFERLRTPEERELSAIIDSQPGGADAVLKNNPLLEKILAKQKTPKGDKPQTVAGLQKEVMKGVDQVLAEEKFFEQKFNAMRNQVDEVKVTVRHESDRVINAVLAGPHERIIDR
ncbi:hypothetical protein MPER_00578, partial [Moniliophthora perniciosa FA553]